jgi:molybdopterin adenylyltransferase
MMSESIEVLSVNVSDEKGTIKHPVPEVTVKKTGIVGDAHAGTPNRLISILDSGSVARFAKEIGRELAFGEFAENITTRGLDMSGVRLLDRFILGPVELEVTQIGKKCHGDNCAIFREVGKCVMPKEGIFCRVVQGGSIKAGQAMEYLPKKLNVKIITLSDRASRGEYLDLSGPLIRARIEEFLTGRKWPPVFETVVIPDDAGALGRELELARESGCDVVFTTGGTGVGPRDITPEVVAGVCDKLIPGIMEGIRMKYGPAKPAVLLSRAVAGLMGPAAVFTLPGSVKAVEEYMTEILANLEHLLLMIHGLDVHGHS